jgi:hypothetical protein
MASSRVDHTVTEVFVPTARPFGSWTNGARWTFFLDGTRSSRKFLRPFDAARAARGRMHVEIFFSGA